MPYITILGAGSTVFARQLMTYILLIDGLDEGCFSLVCDALLKRDREAARYGLVFDPLTAAVCSPAEISAMFDEMWEAERDSLEYFE